MVTRIQKMTLTKTSLKKIHIFFACLFVFLSHENDDSNSNHLSLAFRTASAFGGIVRTEMESWRSCFFEGSISTDYLGDISQVVGAVYLLHM